MRDGHTQNDKMCESVNWTSTWQIGESILNVVNIRLPQSTPLETNPHPFIYSSCVCRIWQRWSLVTSCSGCKSKRCYWLCLLCMFHSGLHLFLCPNPVLLWHRIHKQMHTNMRWQEHTQIHNATHEHKLTPPVDIVRTYVVYTHTYTHAHTTTHTKFPSTTSNSCDNRRLDEWNKLTTSADCRLMGEIICKLGMELICSSMHRGQRERVIRKVMT